MNAILICPSDRPGVAFLQHRSPLALVPILGRPLLDLWLAETAARGAKSVRVLAADRPDLIRRFVRKGDPWGIQVEVIPEQRELSPAEALAKHAPDSPSATSIVVLDHLPPDGPKLWDSTASWLDSLRHHFEPAALDRIGIRQPTPGAFVDARARISPDAILEPPCWIGAHSWIGPRARIGPNSIVESHSYIDEAAEIVESFVGPETYVGALTEIRQSVAWKRHLLKVPTGSAIEIPDGFLLGPVHAAFRGGKTASLPGRLLAFLTLILTSPILLVALLRRPPGSPLFLPRAAVRTPASDPALASTITYHHLAGMPGLLARWPELWAIVQGHFRWVGNRPLTPAQADSLVDEFERLWLGVPAGLLSLADAERCQDPFGDEARAHSSFFAVHPDWRQRLSILRRTLLPTRRNPPLKSPSAPMFS